MAGGTFVTQNKVRPGAYINIKAQKKSVSLIGDRGTVVVPASLNWGAEKEITRVTIDDVISGKSMALIGTDLTDEDSLALQLAFLGASTVLVYRINANGDKATATLGNLTATAKYSGIAGNDIAISIVANGDKYDVITSYKTKTKDKQTVSTIEDLKDNDFVEFSGTGTLAVNAGTQLENGTNGTVSENAYTEMLNAIEPYNFNCIAMPSTKDSDITATITKIKNWREKVGKYVQAVVVDKQADDEGIISIKQSLKIDDTVISKSNVAVYVAGITAGASVNASNTYKVVDKVTEIVDVLSDEEIKENLEKGFFLFSVRQDGAIIVEKDINTLHTFDEKSYAFSKNRVIRTIDEIARTLCLDFERNFIGKVNNDDTGRSIYKASVMSILNEFANLGCVETVLAEDVIVNPGEDIDSVTLDLAIKPIDSMEKLYCTIVVA